MLFHEWFNDLKRYIFLLLQPVLQKFTASQAWRDYDGAS